ncbi:hypothetical protein BS17DRAFT_784710 [Gyrodon lividus]|nr:hypothetical protein BS17DRAFT_784710 [Gyrodon lividus]
MFTLSRPHVSQTGDDDDDNSCDLPAVVLHENRPVAVMEQLYELFCYCHAQAGHGGRDKTCAVIRQHYSWVPKELTSQFVKACPTCTLKRSGNPDLVALVQEHAQASQKEISLKGPDESSPSPIGSWPPTGGPLDPPVNPEPHCFRESLHPHSTLASPRPVSAASSVSANSSANSSTVGTRPVSREVPFVNGLPGGWDYFASSLTDEAGFYSGASDLYHQPGIPSVIFTRESSQEDNRPDMREDGDQAGVQLPSLRRALSDGSLDNNFNLSGLWPENSGECLPPALKQLQILSPVERQPSYLFQVDPVLLALDYAGSGAVEGPASGIELFSLSISGHGSRSFESSEIEASSETNQQKSPTQSQMSPLLGFPSTPSMEALSLCRLRAPDIAGLEHEYSSLSPDSERSDISACPFSFSMLSPGSGYSPLSSALPSPTDEVGKALAKTLSFPPITDADA